MLNAQSDSGTSFTHAAGFPGLELETCHQTPQKVVPQLLQEHHLSVCQTGPATAHYRGARHALTDTTFQLYRAGEALSAGPAKGGLWSYRTLRLSPDLLHAFAKGAGHVPDFSAPVVRDAALGAELNQQLEGVFAGVESGDDVELEANLVALLRLSSRNKVAAKPKRVTVRVERAVETAKAHLTDYFHDAVPLDALAELTGVSKFHLNKMFKQVVGIPPHVFQTSLRVGEAKRRLRDAAPLAHVAVDLGFADQAHFTRTFKRYVGVTPGQYQKV